MNESLLYIYNSTFPAYVPYSLEGASDVADEYLFSFWLMIGIAA